MKNKILIVGVLTVIVIIGFLLSISRDDTDELSVEVNPTKSKPSVMEISTASSIRSLGEVKSTVLIEHIENERLLELETELNSLASEFDSQLDNPEQKKRIKTEFNKKLSEYNKLVIENVKAINSKSRESD